MHTRQSNSAMLSIQFHCITAHTYRHYAIPSSAKTPYPSQNIATNAPLWHIKSRTYTAKHLLDRQLLFAYYCYATVGVIDGVRTHPPATHRPFLVRHFFVLAFNCIICISTFGIVAQYVLLKLELCSLKR